MDPQPTDPRVYMAAERTFLAWIRTGLALMGFGFVVARFGLFLGELASIGAARRQGEGLSLPIGIALICVGIVVIVASALRHRSHLHALGHDGAAPRFGAGIGLTLAAVLALIGLAMAVYLATI
jgi:inner membrane protein YidH